MSNMVDSSLWESAEDSSWRSFGDSHGRSEPEEEKENGLDSCARRAVSLEGYIKSSASLKPSDIRLEVVSKLVFPLTIVSLLCQEWI